MNEEFDKYWKHFIEKMIRLQMKHRTTHDDIQRLKEMRKEKEMLVNYIRYRGYDIDEDNRIYRR